MVLFRIFALVKDKSMLFKPLKKIFNGNNISIVQIRNSSFFRVPKKNASNFKIKDNVPEEYELIYRNGLNNYFTGIQIVGTISVLSIAAFFVYQSDFTKPRFDEWKTVPKTFESDLYVSVVGLILVNVSLLVMLRRFPIRIYNSPSQNKYIMIYYNYLPFTTSRCHFKVSDVIKLEETGFLPWKDSRYEIKSTGKVIMLENYFRRPADLNIMLGYQKHAEQEDDD